MVRADLLNQRFGRLVVVGVGEAVAKGETRPWECRCDCGRTTYARTAILKNGHKQSCGCLGLERRIDASKKANRIHGGHLVPEYQSWNAMKNRCLNANREVFPLYGGRGITLCERWADSFEAFRQDMGPRPSPQHSIERKDGNLGYEPSNCLWATRAEQANNRSTSQRATFRGTTKTIAEWSKELGVPYSTLWNRHKSGRPLA
jgi:hypothetical protein